MNDDRIVRELRIANIPTKIRLGALAAWIFGVFGLIAVMTGARLYGVLVRIFFGGF